MSKLVKICGITNIEDMSAAIKFKVDYLGFVVGIGRGIPYYDPLNTINMETAKSLITNADGVISVVVSHFINAGDILNLAKYLTPDAVQIVEDTSLDGIQFIRKKLPNTKLIKTIAVVNEKSCDLAKSYEKYVDALLLDSRDRGITGGTGITHDWKISKKIVELSSKTTFLAGGLTVENLKDAIEEVNPDGVDVCTGVTASSGKKDPVKMEKFIKIAKSFE